MSATKPARGLGPQERHNYWLIRQIAVDTGLVCGWDASPPEGIEVRRLINAICHIAAIENGSYSQFDKDALYGLAGWADGVRVPTVSHKITSGELRGLLATWAGFEFDGSDSSQAFRKPELQQLLMAVAYQDFQEAGGR
jgi:hypothetical protein